MLQRGAAGLQLSEVAAIYKCMQVCIEEQLKAAQGNPALSRLRACRDRCTGWLSAGRCCRARVCFDDER